jgi:hypothetical protein
MKKNYTLLLFSLLVSATLLSQSVSIELTGGYCAPIASDFSSVSTKEFQSATYPNFYSTYRDLHSTSYGQGGSVALNVNWFSKKDIGCGLRANALFSSPFSYNVYVTYLNGNGANFNFTDRPFSFQLVPHISFKHDFKVVSPILEMGMLLGFTHIDEDYQALYNSGDVVQSTIHNHGSILLGFYSSLGLAFRVSKAVRIMLAINCSVGSYSPTQWERTSFTVNYVDQTRVASRHPYLRGTYVKQLDPSISQPANQPHQDLRYSVPFSNVGFSAGIAFTFGKKKTGTTQPENVRDRNDKNVVHPF